MGLGKHHKTLTNLVVAVMAATIVFYSEQALAAAHLETHAPEWPCFCAS